MAHRRPVETADECFPYSADDPPGSGRWPISALDLPAGVVAKVYAGNAQRLIPALAAPTGAASPSPASLAAQ